MRVELPDPGGVVKAEPTWLESHHCKFRFQQQDVGRDNQASTIVLAWFKLTATSLTVQPQRDSYLEPSKESPVENLTPINGTDPTSGQQWSYWAFVPNPLIDSPTIGLPALNAATKAAMAVARLDQAVSQLPNPEVLLRPIIRREAVSTSALEGTYVAFSDVLEADFLEDRHLSSEQREVRNYVIATEQAIKLLPTYPISRRLLGDLQRTIVRRTPGDSYDAGDLRQKQVCIGAKNRPIEEARFVPAPPGRVLEDGFSDWQRWINTDNDVPIIAKVAIGHYQFETLHPFADGNGRLGRLTAILQLVQEGILRLPILNLAPELESNAKNIKTAS